MPNTHAKVVRGWSLTKGKVFVGWSHGVHHWARSGQATTLTMSRSQRGKKKVPLSPKYLCCHVALALEHRRHLSYHCATTPTSGIAHAIWGSRILGDARAMRGKQHQGTWESLVCPQYKNDDGKEKKDEMFAGIICTHPLRKALTAAFLICYWPYLQWHVFMTACCVS